MKAPANDWLCLENDRNKENPCVSVIYLFI